MPTMIDLKNDNKVLVFKKDILNILKKKEKYEKEKTFNN